MNIVFLTTLNLASNPRLYKEILLAGDLGYKVEVICFEFRNWSYNYNLQLLKNITGCKVRVIAADKKPFVPWLKSVVSEKLFRKTDQFIPLGGSALSQAISRRSGLLLGEAAKVTGKPDWVIAHNPGAFYPALWLAKKKQTRLGIDLEDFHPGETNDTRDQKRLERLIRHILPKADYITAASPLIMKETMDLSPSDAAKEVVLNYFPVNEFLEPKEDKGENLRLVWFSQNISFGRGLETIIPVIDQLSGIELHLFGHMDEDFFNEHLNGKKNIFVHPALSQTELHKMLSEFDIGLALEVSRDNYNRELCLTNKILAYFQAGLYILASDTLAQQEFMDIHSGVGEVISLTSENLMDRLRGLIKNKKELRNENKKRFLLNKFYNWEAERKRLTSLWQS